MKSIIAFVAVTALAIQTVYAHISADEIFPMRRHARRAGHKHQHKRHDLLAVKRSTQCQFPTNVGLVPVTPNQQNAGWAMSPDQPCLPGNYCPYACPSGILSHYDVADGFRASVDAVGSGCHFVYVSPQYAWRSIL